MSDSAASMDDAGSIDAPTFLEAFSLWSRHLASLVIPAITLLFIWTGPHRWYVAPVFMLPLGILLFIDQRRRDLIERHLAHVILGLRRKDRGRCSEES